MSESAPDESSPISVKDIKVVAKRNLSKQAWDYYITGAGYEQTARRNEQIYDSLLVRPRVLRNVGSVDTSTTVFGKQYAFPIAIAPSAYQKLCHPDGEIAMSRAARKLGTNLTLSTNATTSLEEVMNQCGPQSPQSPGFWFQLYVLRDRNVAKDLIHRAEAAGYEALCVTVDTPIIGNRIHERTSPLTLPPGMSKANLKGGASKSRLVLNAKTAAEALQLSEKWAANLNAADLEWNEFVPWLKSQTKLKIVLKGIMTAEDAALAAEHGVDGIVVSNHGGRQLDGAPSTLEVLPEITAAVKGRLPIIFDGGITQGSDVFKALALGADLCLIGRSALWGLAYKGQEGVEDVLHILERDLWRTMTLAGAASVKDISRDMLGVAKTDGFGIAKL
jgi:(S)-2-hydroxy-acid oxidase